MAIEIDFAECAQEADDDLAAEELAGEQVMGLVVAVLGIAALLGAAYGFVAITGIGVGPAATHAESPAAP